MQTDRNVLQPILRSLAKAQQSKVRECPLHNVPYLADKPHKPSYMPGGKSWPQDGPDVGPGDDEAISRLGAFHIHGRIDEGPEERHADAAERLDCAVGHPACTSG